MEIESVSVNQPLISQPGTQEQPARPIEIRLGGAWVRYWAMVIDSFIFGLPALLLAFLLSALMGSPISFEGNPIDNLENSAIYGITALFFYLIYYVYFTANKGATIGKDVYGLKVVKEGTNENISYLRAFAREMIKVGVLAIPFFGVLFYFVNSLVILFSPSKRGFHDRIAKTQVLKIQEHWPMKKQWGCSLVLLIAGIITVATGYLLSKLLG